ncbi:HTH-type transcriptional regulator AnsR [Vallitalea sediminicola]
MIGDILISLRKVKGYEAQHIANLLNVAKSTYSGYENNKSVPNYESLKKIADFYSVSVDYILERTNDDIPPGHSNKEKEINKKLDALMEYIAKTDDITLCGNQVHEPTKEFIITMLKSTKDIAKKMNENSKK